MGAVRKMSDLVGTDLDVLGAFGYGDRFGDSGTYDFTGRFFMVLERELTEGGTVKCHPLRMENWLLMHDAYRLLTGIPCYCPGWPFTSPVYPDGWSNIVASWHIGSYALDESVQSVARRARHDESMYRTNLANWGFAFDGTHDYRRGDVSGMTLTDMPFGFLPDSGGPLNRALQLGAWMWLSDHRLSGSAIGESRLQATLATERNRSYWTFMCEEGDPETPEHKLVPRSFERCFALNKAVAEGEVSGRTDPLTVRDRSDVYRDGPDDPQRGPYLSYFADSKRYDGYGKMFDRDAYVCSYWDPLKGCDPADPSVDIPSSEEVLHSALGIVADRDFARQLDARRLSLAPDAADEQRLYCFDRGYRIPLSFEDTEDPEEVLTGHIDALEVRWDDTEALVNALKSVKSVPIRLEDDGTDRFILGCDYETWRETTVTTYNSTQGESSTTTRTTGRDVLPYHDILPQEEVSGAGTWNYGGDRLDGFAERWTKREYKCGGPLYAMIRKWGCGERTLTPRGKRVVDEFNDGSRSDAEHKNPTVKPTGLTLFTFASTEASTVLDHAHMVAYRMEHESSDRYYSSHAEHYNEMEMIRSWNSHKMRFLGYIDENTYDTAIQPPYKMKEHVTANPEGLGPWTLFFEGDLGEIDSDRAVRDVLVDHPAPSHGDKDTYSLSYSVSVALLRHVAFLDVDVDLEPESLEDGST